MIKDTNPDHYKVEGANFIEYMNDPKISGFGNWMFANGFNSGVWASTNWISVKDRMPAETHSMFFKLYGTPKWRDAMWQEESDNVLVAITFEDGSQFVTSGYTQDGKWHTGISKMLPYTVTHWMLLPEPPEVNQDD